MISSLHFAFRKFASKSKIFVFLMLSLVLFCRQLITSHSAKFCSMCVELIPKCKSEHIKPQDVI